MIPSRLGSAMLLLTLCAVALIACGDEVAFTDATEAPKAGTSIVGYQYHYDGMGVLREQIADSAVIGVLPTLAAHAGKGSVVPFAIALDDAAGTTAHTYDTIYAHYEPNGDLSVKFDRFSLAAPGTGGAVEVPDSWIVLPFGAKVNTGQVRRDTSYTIRVGNADVPSRVQVTTTQEFIGPSSITTAIAPLNVLGVKVHHVITTVGGEAGSTVASDITYYYAPKLGAIVKYDEVNLIGTSSGTVLQELNHRGWQTLSYTLVK